MNIISTGFKNINPVDFTIFTCNISKILLTLWALLKVMVICSIQMVHCPETIYKPIKQIVVTFFGAFVMLNII